MPRHKIVGQSLLPLPYSHSPTGATRHKETENVKQEVSQQDKGEESRTYSPIPISFWVQIGECGEYAQRHAGFLTLYTIRCGILGRRLAA